MTAASEPRPFGEPKPPGSPRRRRRNYAIGSLIGVLLVAVVLGTSGAWQGSTLVNTGPTGAGPEKATAAGVPSQTTTPSATATPGVLGEVPPAGTAPILDLRSVLRTAEPGVVDITDYGAPKSGTSSGQATGEGSGMVLDAAGHVLTNAHVVSGGTTFSVQVLGLSTLYQAKVLAADTTDDVAVIQIVNPGPLTPVTLGHSSGVEVGDPVVAIGNALGLTPGGPSITTGIISALGRSLTTDNGSGGTESLTNLIQTDAAINPGNSGGPLVDASGQVVGMNTAISSGSQNIGFSIPIDRITPLLSQLEDGTVPASNQAYLGVTLQNPTTGSGAQIETVQAGSPAANAGLQVNDIVTAVNGQTVDTAAQAQGDVQVMQAGAQITLQIIRAGAPQTVTATLGSRPPATPSG